MHRQIQIYETVMGNLARQGNAIVDAAAPCGESVNSLPPIVRRSSRVEPCPWDPPTVLNERDVWGWEYLFMKGLKDILGKMKWQPHWRPRGLGICMKRLGDDGVENLIAKFESDKTLNTLQKVGPSN